MRRILVVTLLIGGIGLVGMVGVLSNARREAATDIIRIYFYADGGLQAVQPDGREQQLLSTAINFYGDSFVRWSDDGG